MEQPHQHVLDNPAWSALTGQQTHLRQGAAHVLRYHPDIGPFVAWASATPQAVDELGLLIAPNEYVLMQSLTPLPRMEGIQAEQLGSIRQMVAAGEPDDASEDEVIRLSTADAREMFELVQKTKPGPFGTRTHETGNYIGLRDNGRLIAMAGERMRLDGYVEISAVCVDDAYRGKGLAGRLINVLRREILQRGDTPFLHVYAHNHAAIALYERLGFVTRQTFLFYKLSHAQGA